VTITLVEYGEKHPDGPPLIPIQYAGEWIAWDSARRQIVAHGLSMSGVRRDAIAGGHADPILQKVPRGPFVGGA
jgi:hypothetical protein